MFRLTVAVAAAVSVLALVGVASAGNVHLAGGKNAEPSFNDLGTDLQATVDVAGLGNFDTQLSITANGTASGTSTCANPSENDGKDQQPAGQNPAAFPVTATGTVVIPGSEIKNGRVQITALAETAPLTFEAAGAPDCPSGNWTETVTITDVAFTSATLTIKQDTDVDGSYTDEVVALSVGPCLFSPATSDGSVPAADVSC